MAYTSGEGGYGTGAATSAFHLDPSHPDTVSIPDAELLFRGHFGRSGPDLVITSQDGHRHIVPGYFASEKHPALVAPNGAHLSGDLVDHLAGSPMPGHYAQAQTTTPTDPVGQIEKVVGIADVVRNGVSVTLHVGDKVFQSDIIQTGADLSCGVSFPDGTALNLVANTRMVLNEYSFNANSTSNTALFSLVEGTFAAVAGAVAHTGNMKVGTPVATMGIRGTTFVLGTILGEVFFLLREDYHTDHHKGALAIENFGITIADTDYVTYCTTTSCRSEPLTNSQNALFRNIIDGLDDVIDRSTTNPKNLDHIPGSGDNPNLLLPLPQFLQENVTPPIFINVGFNPGNSNPPPNNFGVINFSPLFTPTLTPPSGPASTIFIWNSTGAFPWPTNGDWNNGQPPGQPTDQVVVQSGTLNYNLPGTTSLLSLTVDAGATLLITSGELMTVNLFDYGTIIVQGDPPILLVNGPAVIGPSGQFIVTGSGDQAEFTGSTLDNQGLIAAAQGGEVLILNELVTNEAGAKIVSGGDGSFVNFKGTSLALFDAVDNFGKLIAAYGGSIAFEFSEVMNEASGELTSIGHGSVIGLSDANFFNLGDVVAKDGGEIAFLDAYADNENNGLMEAKAFSTLSFVNTDVVNETGALIEADGRDAEIKFDRGYVSNTGRIEAEDGGEVSFYESHVDNDRSGVIEADGRGSEIEFGRDHINNSGRIEAEYGGEVSFYELHVDNNGSGVIEADGYGSEVKFDRDSINNDGTIGARFGGVVDVNDSTIMQGRDGIIEAVGYNSTVNLDNATIIGGTLLIGDHGRVDIEGGRNGGATLDDVRVDNDGTIRVDDPAQATKLTLEDGTIVHGGVLSIGDRGTVDIEGGRNGGATLDDVRVDNDGTIRVDYETNTTTLTLEDGTVVHGGILSIGDRGTVDIEGGRNGGATLDDVRVDNDGTIQVDYETNTTTLTLEDGTIVHGGVLSIGDRGTVDIEQGRYGGATLDDVRVDNDGTIRVDYETNTTTLTLEDGTIVHGGMLSIGDHGTVDIEQGRYGGATLDDVRVDNDGTIRVDYETNTTTLTLEDGTIVHGGMLSIGDRGTVDIEGGRNGGATLDDVTVWNRGDIKVDEETGPQTTLHLTDGTTVNGGTLTIGRYGEVDIQAGDHANGATLNNVDVWNDGIITFGGGDAGGSGDPDLFIGGTVALRGAGQLILSGSNDNIVGTREGGELDNYSNIVGTGHIGNGDRSLTFDNEAHGLVDATGLLVIDTGCQTIDNDGSLKASGGGELLVKSGVDNFWGSIAADAGSTVDLEGLVRGGDAMIAGGTLIFAAAWGVETSFANDTPHNTSTLVLEGTGLSFVTDAIAGFSHGDIIDLADITFNSCGPSKTSFSLFGDYLTVSDGLHGPSMTIQLDGIYNASDIVLSKDTNGDTQVEFDSPPVITGT